MKKYFGIILFIVIFLIAFFCTENKTISWYIIGFAIIVHACYLGYQIKVLIKYGITTNGTIKDFSIDSDCAKFPIIEFITEIGEQVNGIPINYSQEDLDKFKLKGDGLNQQVTILYNKVQPSKFILNVDTSHHYFTSIYQIFFGLFFIAIGILNHMKFI
jgi:hypothetical protein